MTGDFGRVVEHCEELLKGDPSLEYLAVTKTDGFSIICDRSAWYTKSKTGPEWHPAKRVETSGVGIWPLVQRRVFFYSQPLDVSGIEWGWIHVGLSVQSFDRSVASMYRRTGILAIGGVVLSLAASALYARRIVRPILSLRNVVQRVAGGDLSVRVAMERRDELGALAHSVNVMTEALLARTQELRKQIEAKDRAFAELAQAQAQLVETSRQAGMAEIATGVLHNVGNVLNSVNVSVTLLGDRVRHSKRATLTRVCALLESHRANLGEFLTSDPKGQLVPELLSNLAAVLEEEQGVIQSELKGLVKNVEHIKEIVSMQQSYARVAGAVED